ncbi:hypothetical protein GQ54DRAFT_55377 [Martensiomyces pterosporus]|nr:hypothetical protein GQ54DRAFT_55377 [Martensiomyces pterosporus]
MRYGPSGEIKQPCQPASSGATLRLPSFSASACARRGEHGRCSQARSGFWLASSSPPACALVITLLSTSTSTMPCWFVPWCCCALCCTVLCPHSQVRPRPYSVQV